MASDELDPSASGTSHEEVLSDEGRDADESRGAPGWFISVGVHCLFGLLFYCAVWATVKEEVELPPGKMTIMDPPAKIEEKRDIERKLDTELVLNTVPEDSPVAPVSQFDVPVEPVTTTQDDIDAKIAKGREEAPAISEAGSNGAFMAIGANSGASGTFGNRSGGGKRIALARGHGSPGSESAVNAALRWFKRHQSPNGMWDAEKYPVNCNENPKCEPGSTASDGGSEVNAAMTGYAILCYLGAGYDHKTPNQYKSTVEKGLNYLRSIQSAEGNFGPRNYEQGVATMALAEAFAMTSDPELKQAAQKGINVIIARQAKDAKGDAAYAGLGWDYVDGKAERIDASVSGWCVMALKSGLAANLNVGPAMDGAAKWVRRHWEATNPEWNKLKDPYADTSTFAYTWDSTTDKIDVGAPGKSHDLAPVGALCSVFLGHHSGDLMLETLCNHVMKYQFPTKYPCNTYFMYYNTLAIFQAGGERWEKWNNSVRDLLVNAQRKGADCYDGSWDYAGTEFHGSDTGRVLSTAYCCLSLEVYYRYAQVGGMKKGAH